MMNTLQQNPLILHPTHPSNFISALFATDRQKSYIGLHEALRSLSQWWAPLLVWFLVVHVKQMKLQRLKDSELVVMDEEADRDGLTSNSTMSYSIVAEYEKYYFVSVDLDDIEFIWPPRQQSKGTSKGQEDDLIRKYGGFQPGNVVRLEVQVPRDSNVTMELIVA